MNRDVAVSMNRLTDALVEHNRREDRRERAADDRERRRRLAEGPVARRPGAEYDALGRLVPSRLDALSFTRAIPGYLARFDKRVPAEMTAKVSVDEIEVACPCGESHLIPARVPSRGACGRHFIYDGVEVRVASA